MVKITRKIKIEISEEEARAFMKFFGKTSLHERKNLPYFDEINDDILIDLYDKLFEEFEN